MTEQLTEEAPVTEVETGPPAPIRIAWAPVPRVNLLPFEIVESRRFRRTQVMLGSAVLGVLVLAGAGTYLAQQQVTEANDQLIASQARVSTLQTEAAKYSAVPKAIAQVDAAVTARTLAMGTDVLWYRYLNDLDGATPNGVRLTSITVGMNTATSTTTSVDPLTLAGIGTLTVDGTADQYDEVSSWLEAIDKITGVASPALTSAGQGTDEIDFSNTAVINADALSGRYDKKAG